MTNEEAINTLKSLKQYYNDKNEDSYVCFDDEDNESIDMAIQALEQQPCEDCISRQAAIDTVVFECGEWIGLAREISKQLRQLPPVTPERPKGKWIEIEDNSDEYHFECSECGQRMNWVDENDNYCNNCGSDNSESTKELFKEWDTKIAEMSGGGEDDLKT